MKVYKLRCAVCGKPATRMQAPYVCEYCKGQFEADISVNDQEFREMIRNGCQLGVWDYRKVLPVEGIKQAVSMGEGATPYVNADSISAITGLKHVYLKNETLNPSGTYKDRFSTIALSIEKEKGTKAVALGSAGNAAASVASYSAKGGIPCFVLLPPGAVAERAWQVRGYGANLIRIENTIDDCIRHAKMGEDIFGWKSLTTNMLTNPLASEGYKTISYEIAKQSDYELPDWIIVPVGGAALLSKIYKGFKDLKEHGVTDKIPHIAAAQSARCAPLVKAFDEGLSVPEVWPGIPSTIAFAIADVCAYDGVTALDAIKATGGYAESAEEEEILEAMNWLSAKEGLVAEPASACTVACLRKMAEKGIIRPEETAACIITGNGMRDLKLFNEGKEEVPYIHYNDDEAFIETVRGRLSI